MSSQDYVTTEHAYADESCPDVHEEIPLPECYDVELLLHDATGAFGPGKHRNHAAMG